MSVEIRALAAAGGEEAVLAARALFDHEPDIAATRRFLADRGHHLLVAYDAAGEPVGFVTGVELTHPDKGSRARPRARLKWDFGAGAHQHER